MKSLQGDIDAIRRDVLVTDQTQVPAMGNGHTRFTDMIEDRLPIARWQAGKDHVGLAAFQVDFEAGQFGQALRQTPGIGVIFGQAFNIVLERIKPACCQYPCLTHGAAQQFALAPRPGNHISGPGQNRADRRTKALG